MAMNHRTTTQVQLFPDLPVYTEWCYCIVLPDHTLHIGWTARSPWLRGREGGGNLLWYCPGDRALETRFHAYYADERIGRSELFNPSPRLAVHNLRRACRLRRRTLITPACRELFWLFEQYRQCAGCPFGAVRTETPAQVSG